MDPNKLIEALKSLAGLFPSKSKRAEFIFKYKPDDFPPCHTRILREGRGFPWNRQLAGHRLPNGHFELTPVERPGQPPEAKKLLK